MCDPNCQYRKDLESEQDAGRVPPPPPTPEELCEAAAAFRVLEQERLVGDCPLGELVDGD